MKRSKSIVEIVSVAIVVLLWQFVPVPTYLLPKPSQILTELIRGKDVILRHTLVTLYEATLGYVLALVLGVAIASVMFLLRNVARALLPIIVFTQTIPITVVAPIVAIWFGFGIGTKIGTVAFLCFFPIVMNTYEGFKTVDREKLEFLKAHGAKWHHKLRYLYLPHTVPYTLAGMKVAITYSLTAAVIAEWMGAQAGLGIYIIRALNSFRVDRVFTAVFIIVMFTLALFYTLQFLQRKLFPWATRLEGGG
ncbi:MAG: ABC transporter permease [Thermotoga caldifontis]|uniref:ABC transporter permease n=1 Tax=Thermotoga caldifontis TaxID=1508419 RepID=UPI003C7C71CE